MRRFIDDDEFYELFQEFEHTAYRLETRERYVVDYEDDPFSAFLAGRPQYDWIQDWEKLIRGAVAEGKRFERVRVVSEPPSDYTRFSLDVARLNVDAGEDIRYLLRPRAEELGLPDEDYWLFDSRIAVIFHFGADGRITERKLTDEPTAIVQRNYWRDVAQHSAIKRDEYAAAHSLT